MLKQILFAEDDKRNLALLPVAQERHQRVNDAVIVRNGAHR